MNPVSPELQEIRTLAHEFALAELRPNTERWDYDAKLDDAVLAQLGELGFTGMRLAEAHGGMGFDLATWAAALEELAWGEPSLAIAVALHTHVTTLVQEHGSEALRTRWLEPLGAGAAFGAAPLASPADGAMPGATREGAGWRLRGTLPWVASVQSGGALLVPAQGKAGPTLFLVPVDETEPGAPAALLGLRPLQARPVTLDVVVEDDAQLGAPGSGATLLAESTFAECIGIGAIAIGIAQAALDHARGYAAEREQFGRALRSFEGLKLKLAELAIRSAAARALLQEAAAGQDPARARMAKVFASGSAMHAATEAVQIFGGYGYMRDYPVEKLMRDARALALLGGSDEEHRLVIADALYAE